MTRAVIGLLLCVIAHLAFSHQRVELHVHLDGATSFSTLFEVATKRNLTLPKGVAPDPPLPAPLSGLALRAQGSGLRA